ncbi:MAG: alpha/beta fold hydrolase [Actinophytocola sp.]|nr:alpha/beta fold hydrolase [Actinophytocola sp.]
MVTAGIGLVLIHGAGLGGWIWRDMTSSLTAPVLAAELPERDGEPDTRKNLSLDDYAEGVWQQLADLPAERVVVVAHSLGGVVGLKVADRLRQRLAGFVAVSAAIPAGGGSFVSSLPMPKRLIVGGLMRIFGTTPPTTAIRQGLCSDLTEEVVRRFAPEFQLAMARNLGTEDVRQLAAGHLAMLSRPAELAGVFNDFASTLAAESDQPA